MAPTSRIEIESDSDGSDDGPDNPYVRELFAFPDDSSSEQDTDSSYCDEDQDDNENDDKPNHHHHHPLITHDVESFEMVNDNLSTTAVKVHYHLALLARGHGNSVWNSSRCIAQHLIDPASRRELLLRMDDDDDDIVHSSCCDDQLFPTRVLEVGAGAALPSLAMLYLMTTTAMAEAAAAASTATDTDAPTNKNKYSSNTEVGSVVISDLVDTDQLTFEALNMSIQRNLKLWTKPNTATSTTTAEVAKQGTDAANQQQEQQQQHQSDDKRKSSVREEIQRNVHIVSHKWGESVDPLLQCISSHHRCSSEDVSIASQSQSSERRKYFDIVIASDCIYNPTHHHALLSSVTSCLDPTSSRGRFVVGYSYHPNVPPSQVDSFFDMATSGDAFDLEVVSHKAVEYKEGQIGIGSTDPDRGTVYLKVLRRRRE